jgi:hypothetical protein
MVRFYVHIDVLKNRNALVIMIKHYALSKGPWPLNHSTRRNIPEYFESLVTKIIEFPGKLKLNVLLYWKAHLLLIPSGGS